MSQIEVKDISTQKLDRINAVLSGIGNGSGSFKAVSNAMKIAAKSAKTQAGRYAAETYNISKKDFMSKCVISSKLSGDHGGVSKIEIKFAGTVIPLIEFGAKGSKKGGVYAAPKKKGGYLARAWIMDIISGERNVYERVSTKRLPIEKKYGPSTGHMMQDEGVSERLTDHIVNVFDSRIEHEITRILSGNYK